MAEYTAVYSKKMVEINISSYFRKDATTFEKQDYDEEEEEDEEEEKKRDPKYVNHRVDVGWGFCDKNGKVWKVKFYYTHWCDTYKGRTYITVKR